MLKSIHFSSFFLVHQGVFYTFFSCRNCASCPENHPQQAAAVGICGNLFNTKRLGFLQTFFCACFSLLHSTLLEGASARGCCSVLRKEKRKQKRNQEQFFLYAGKDTRATTCHPNIDVFSFFSIGPPGHLTCVRQHDPSRPGAGLIFLSFRETGLDSEP